MHLTAYTVLKRQLLDCLGQFLESNGGQFLASAEEGNVWERCIGKSARSTSRCSRWLFRYPNG